MCGRLRDMKHLPFPLRLAAGIAVTTAERVRELPKQLTELPVTVASQVLQTSMRVQQHVTELAIRGDDALSSLRPAEEAPSWATFDEDLPSPSSGTRSPFDSEDGDGPSPEATTAARGDGGTSTNGYRPVEMDTDLDEDPWAAEEHALADEHHDGEFDSPASPDTAPAGLADYDELTLPQVRARLRRFSLPELEELLDYEKTHANRSSFTGMLTRRIGNVRQSATAPPGALPEAPEGTENTAGESGIETAANASGNDGDTTPGTGMHASDDVTANTGPGEAGERTDPAGQ